MRKENSFYDLMTRPFAMYVTAAAVVVALALAAMYK